MTTSLGELIDMALATGEWRSIQIFSCDDGSGFMSLRRRRHPSSGEEADGYVAEHSTDITAPISERLRAFLAAEMGEKVAPSKSAIDDLLDDI